MMQFALHPNIYATGHHRGLRALLEEIWIRSLRPGEGAIYILTGFANYNGGARFYRTFREHTERGGTIVAVVGGSTTQRTTSRQVAQALLDCGATLYVTNRRSLMHAKCYGSSTPAGQNLIVSSGNFTGPGMSRNVEAALHAGPEATQSMGFSWEPLIEGILHQNWQIHQPLAIEETHPVWTLLYDETPGDILIDQTDLATMVLTLGRSDTARILASPGTNASLGSQYFWLSKDCFDFFPPLTIRNERGYKGTLSSIIALEYVDLGEVDDSCRVTFEAENNQDFRLGTGRLRNSRLARPGDLACVTRLSETQYQLRIVPSTSHLFGELDHHATNYVGHREKRYGFIPNDLFHQMTGFDLPTN